LLLLPSVGRFKDLRSAFSLAKSSLTMPRDKKTISVKIVMDNLF